MTDNEGQAINNNLKKSKLVNADGSIVNTQYNRVFSIQISRTPKWSFTLTQDFTNAYEGAIPVDPYYNPLEALISGDFKYFLGARNTVKPPSWIKNRWVSAEFSYNITSSQRISVMYGSIQGGLFAVMECVESYQLLMMGLRFLTVQAFKFLKILIFISSIY